MSPLGSLQLPQPCHLCGSYATAALCHACAAAARDTRLRCRRCALPLSGAGALCGECLSQPPAFVHTLCACDHSAPGSDWLNRFKHQGDLTAGELLIRQLAERVELFYAPQDRPQWLIPTPMHWRAQLLRGFNQAAWISRRLSRQLQIPALMALRRVAAGPPQKSLSRRERQRNLRGCFSVCGALREQVVGCRLALIDDVMTTGASARLLSQLLLDAGAARVDVWCLTRTPKRT